MEQDKIYDITIIGGGPIGMFSAFYAGLRQMSVKVIESLPQLGGQLATLYPEKYIYDIAGFPKVRAQELVDNLKEQMDQFNPTVCLNETVENITKQEDGSFFIETNQGVHFSKSILITAGNGAFKPRKLEIEGSEKFENKNLSYFVTDMSVYQGKRVLLLGGGDSAVDWALMLEPIAKEVYLAHRRDKFRAHEHSVDTLKRSSVQVLTPYVLKELVGEDQIEKCVLQHVKTEEEKAIEVDSVIVNYGFVSSLGPIKDWGLEIQKNSIVVNSKMETNIEGIFAVGDICTYEGKVKLIATGFGEAPIAVSHAKVYVDPNAKTQPLHSTSIMGKGKEKVSSTS